MLVEVDVEVGLLGGSLLGSQQREALTERCGGVGVLTWGQVVQQHGPQDLKTDRQRDHCQVVQHGPQHLKTDRQSGSTACKRAPATDVQ